MLIHNFKIHLCITYYFRILTEYIYLCITEKLLQSRPAHIQHLFSLIFYDTLLFFVYNPVHSQERVIHTQFLYINKKSHFIVEIPCVGVSSFVHSRPRLLWLPY